MTTETLFLAATRNKFRFPYRGLVSVEDLWDLSVQNLDNVFKTLNAEMKQVQEESLLNTKTAADKELETKIEIVKYIVSVKLAELEKKMKEKELKEQKQKILEVLAEREDADLKQKPVEELRAMLDEMDKI